MEVMQECMERMGKILPQLSGEAMAQLAEYAEQLADRAAQETNAAQISKQ